MCLTSTVNITAQCVSGYRDIKTTLFRQHRPLYCEFIEYKTHNTSFNNNFHSTHYKLVSGRFDLAVGVATATHSTAM